MAVSNPSRPLSVPSVPEEGVPPRGRRRWEFVIAGSLFLLLGLWFALAMGTSHLRQIRAGGFVAVSAVVIDARVAEWGSRPRNFGPAITYRYRIDGVEHTADRYQFSGEGWRSREAAAATVARYPVGATVTAYADPADPANAVLNNARPGGTGIGALILLVYLAFALLVIRHGWRRKG